MEQAQARLIITMFNGHTLDRVIRRLPHQTDTPGRAHCSSLNSTDSTPGSTGLLSVAHSSHRIESIAIDISISRSHSAYAAIASVSL